jgi:hypothetical protein
MKGGIAMFNKFLRLDAVLLLTAAVLTLAPCANAQQPTNSTQQPQPQTSNTQAATATPTPTPTPMPTPAPTPSTQQPQPAVVSPAEAEPLFREFKGVTIGMSAEEARAKLGNPQEKDKVQDFFVFSERERARVYYDGEGKVSAVIVTYIGRDSNAPAPSAILGAEVTPKADGSMYHMVQYPKAGYWVAYSRTAGDEPLTIITMQKR